MTGSSDGIGAVTADALAGRGMSVVRHARDAARAEELRERYGRDVEVVTGDLASMDSTRALADQVIAAGPFDVVVHNAGWLSTSSVRSVTEDGIERMLQVNAVGPYLLTALTPLPARLVYVSSDSMRGVRLDLDDLQSERDWETFRAYGRSKIALTAVAFAVARRYPGVTCTAVHPGWVRTKMSGDQAPLSLEAGADTAVWLALGEDAARQTGRLFFERRPISYNDQPEDPAVQAAVLAELARLTGVDLPPAAGRSAQGEGP